MTQKMDTVPQSMDLPMNSHIAVVDLGSNSLKLVIGEVVDGKLVSVLAAVSAVTDGIRNGVIYNVREVADGLSELLEDAYSVCGIRPDSVAVTFSDPGVGMYDNDAMVVLEEEIVRRSHVQRVINLALQSFPSKRELYVLHAMPRNFMVDKAMATNKPIGLHGIRLDVDAMLITVQKQSIEVMKRTFREAGLNVTRFVYAPVAVTRSVLSDREKRLGALVVDMGSQNTSVLFIKNDVVRFVATYAAGSKLLSDDIAAVLQCLDEEAEMLKIQHGAAHVNYVSDPDEPVELEGALVTTRGEVARIIHARLVEIFSAIQHDLAKHGIHLPTSATVVLTGGGSRLKGMERFAWEVFKRRTRLGYPSVPGTTFDSAKDVTFGAAVGLLRYMAEKLEHQAEGSRGSRDTGPLAAVPPPPPPAPVKKPPRKRGFFDSKKFKAITESLIE